ncbi:hypothetical protein HMPREF1062_01805, partial [Bacteroides cellulosilyticus CL02T12C19]
LSMFLGISQSIFPDEMGDYQMIGIIFELYLKSC